MSTLLERASKPVSAGKKAAPWVPSRPQVNLLPPEVHASRALQRLKSLLALVLLVVVALCGLWYFVAMGQANSARDSLSEAQNRTTTLLAEKAKYASANGVVADLTKSKNALRVGTSTEVMWAPYVNAIVAVLPQTVSIDSLTITGSTPTTPAAVTTDPLVPAGIGSVAFSGKVLTVPDASAWVDALNSVPGFANATFSSVQIQGDETDQRYYSVAATVQVTDAALANRFAQEDGGK